MTSPKHQSTKLKLNVAMAGFTPGSVITIGIDENGVPTDKYWRRRLADAAHDNCVELVKEPKSTKSSKSPKEE